MVSDRRISPQRAFLLTVGRDEIAFLDVREAGQFGDGHPFLATPCPYSRFERNILDLVPNKNVPVILIDDGDHVGNKALQIAQKMGYSNLSVVDGGIQKWESTGARLFKGVNVPSKTLGELAEHYLHPKTITPQELNELLKSKDPPFLFDCRPPMEYQKMTIPGARSAPNGELAYRQRELISNENTPVIVTCAGRTRGIIGALGLKLSGVKNPVYALENGSQGWVLEGLSLARSNQLEPLPEVCTQSKLEGSLSAKSLLAKLGVTQITAQEARKYLEQSQGTTYLFDIRSEAEFFNQMCPFAQHVWGVQLIQATDQWIGVRRSRIILIDDTGLRAALAAIWLHILGYSVCFLPIEEALKLCNFENSSHLKNKSRQALEDSNYLKKYSAKDAFDLSRNSNVLLIDSRQSMDYRKAHAKGSRWLIRPKVPKFLKHTDLSNTFILIDDQFDRLQALANELKSNGAVSLGYVYGGMQAWKDENLPIKTSQFSPPDHECIDFLFFTHGRHDGNLADSRLYLEWEKSLIKRLHPHELNAFDLGFLQQLQTMI